MKIIYILFFLFSIFQSCINTLPKTEDKKSQMQNKEHCSFEMSSNLQFKPIDTTKFAKESYFKIGSSISDNIMQIFVYDTQIDALQKTKDQQEALNTPDVFSAKTITPINKIGKYNCSGILMEGVYAGGIIKGKIKVFAYSDAQKGFVFIRQYIGGSNNDTEDFDQIENTFTLK